MFKSTVLIPAYKSLIGWRQHFDSSEITLSAPFLVSDSGEYYQDKSPALRLDYIKATLPTTQTLENYLNEKMESGINGIFNDIIQKRQISEFGKTLLEQSQLLNRHSWVNDKITNQGRFVGFQINVRALSGLQTVINEIGVQLDTAQTLTLHLFHSSKEDALQTFDVTTTDSGWSWKSIEQELNSFLSEQYHGGVFVLGYSQADVAGTAINYTNFNWDKGECAGCNSNQYYNIWRSIKDYFAIYPLYWTTGNFTVGKMPNLEDAIYINDTSFGLNLKLSVRCDLTEFFKQNRFVFKNLLNLKVAHLIMNDMKFCQQTNFVEENLKMMIIRDLEGDKETNALNISQQYERELKAVVFNMEGINNKCLSCSDVNSPIIDVL